MRFGLLVPVLIAATAPAGPPQNHLNKPKLDGFIVGSQEDRTGQSTRKMVPQGETVDHWNRMVIDVRLADLPYSDLPSARRLDDIVDRHTRTAIKGCPDPQIGPIYSYPLVGKEIAKFRIICERPAATDHPLASFNIFILDHQTLFQRIVAFRHMPSATEAKWAKSIVDTTRVCAVGNNAAGC